MLELYHWEPNGESLALLICLKEKALDYKSHYVDMLQLAHHEADYLAKSAGGLVPALVDGGEVMNDANFALQYLVDKYPDPRLAPSDASGWYDVQAWASFLTVGLAVNVRLLGWNQVMLKSMPAADLEALRAKIAAIPKVTAQAGWAAVMSDAEASEDQLANARERVQQVVGRMEETLTGAPWLVGSDYSITDIQAFSYCHVLPELLPDMVNEAKTPKTMKWLGVVANRPAVKAALAMRNSSVAKDVYAAPGTERSASRM